MYYTRPVKNKLELNKALNLVISTFKKESNLNYTKLLKIIWENKRNKSYENVLIYTNNIEIIGVIRLVPKTMTFDGLVLSAVGLTNVSIHQKFQKKGYSRSMMDQAMLIIEKRGYELSFLIARRNIDFYYNKFGFYGSSSYNLSTINSPSQKDNITNNLINKNYNEDNIYLYNTFYELCYEDCFGKFNRDQGYWQEIFVNIKNNRDFVFNEILNNNKLIGYIVYYKNQIVELAFDPQAISDFLKHLDKLSYPLIISIPAKHKLNFYIDHLDVTFTSRKCFFGGHMLRWTNENKIKISIG